MLSKIICAGIIILALFGIANAQPILDPNPNAVVHGTFNGNGAFSLPPMSTTNIGDVIVIVTSSPFSSAGAGSSPNLYTGQRLVATPSSKITVQYAYAHGVLTNEVIPVGSSGSTINVVAFAISGTQAAATSAFELGNSALPASNASGVTPLTTINADDLLIEACRTTNTAPTAGSGWTQVYGGANNFLVEVMGVTSTQSALSPTLGVGTTASACSGDAVQQTFTRAVVWNSGRLPALGSLGTNVEFIFNGDAELPFANILGQSNSWQTVNNIGTAENQEDCIQIDSNGYPTTLTAGSGPNCSPQNWTHLFEAFVNGMNYPFYPAVQYTVIATGTCGITIGGDASASHSYTSAVLDTSFTFTPTPSPTGLTFTITSEGSPYCSLLAVVPTTQVAAYLAGGTGIVNPAWSTAFADYCIIRGMDMTNTLSANGADITSQNWGDIRGPNYQNYGPYFINQVVGGSRSPPTNGATSAGSFILNFAAVPSWVKPGMLLTDLTSSSALPPFYSIWVVSKTTTTVTMNVPAINSGVGNGDAINFGSLADHVPTASLVQLVNSIGADLWLNTPIGATLNSNESGDPYVAQEAATVLAMLTPNANVDLEFSNEFWHNGKQQEYAAEKAAALWTGTFTGSLSAGVLTVASVPTNANMVSGEFTISGAGITAGATICSQLTGIVGGVGTYNVDTNSNCNTPNADSVSSEAVTYTDNGKGDYAWFGYRAAQVCQEWKSVWAAASPPQDFRIVCMLGGQLSNSGVQSGVAMCAPYNGLGALGPGPCAGYGYQGIDAVITAPYPGYQVPDGWLTLDPPAAFTASASNGVMTVSAVSSGTIVPFMELTSGTGVPVGFIITQQIDATHWAINSNSGFSSTAVTGQACAILCLTKLYQEFNVGGAINQTQTGTVTAGNTTITGLADTTQLTADSGGPGIGVSDGGNCIPANTVISAIPTGSSVTINNTPTNGTSPSCASGAPEVLTFTGPAGGMIGQMAGPAATDIAFANLFHLTPLYYEGGMAGLGAGGVIADAANAIMSAAMMYQTTVTNTSYGNMITSNANFWSAMLGYGYKGGNHFSSIDGYSGTGNGDWGLAANLPQMATSPKNLGTEAYIAAHRARPVGYPCSSPRIGHH